MKSKRAAFRYPGRPLKLKYRTAYDEGDAWLTNISTDGCAFESATVPLSVDEKILIKVSPQGTEKSFEAQSLVVRADENGYAIRFILLEPENKTLIRNYFSQKMREK